MDTRKSITRSMWLIAQPLLLSAIGLPATAYVIRSLGPMGYGQWAVGTSLVGAISVLTSLGLRPLYARRVAQEPDAAREEMPYQLGLRGLLALAAMAVVMLLCVGLRYPPVVVACTAITAFGLLLSTLGGVMEDVLLGSQRLKEQAIVNLVSGILLTTLSVVAVWLGGGPIGVAISYITGPIAGLALLTLLVKRQNYEFRLRYSVDRFRSMMRDSRLVGLGFIVAAARDRVEQLLVPKLVGIAGFGYFAAGVLLADRLTAVPSGVTSAFFPFIAHLHKEDPDASSRSVTRLLMLALLTCLPIAVLTTFLAEPVAQLLFPGKADVCRVVIRITIWSLPLVGVWSSMGISLQASSAHDAAARAGLLTSLVSILVSVPVIWYFGIVGACASWVLRPAMGIMIYLPAFRHHFPHALSKTPVIRIVLCALAMSGILWSSTILVTGVLTMGVAGALSLVCYMGLTMVFRVVNTDDLRKLLRAKPPVRTHGN